MSTRATLTASLLVHLLRRIRHERTALNSRHLALSVNKRFIAIQVIMRGYG